VYDLTVTTRDSSGYIIAATGTQDLSKDGYRLPTEMEWMWAAMGADRTTQPNTTGYAKPFAGNGAIGDNAWYDVNSGSKTHQVSQKNANELGLRDMSGNVFEWCWDWYDGYPTGAQTDFLGAASGGSRVFRGGGWYLDASGCTVAFRGYTNPSNRYSGVGFRVVAGD
jgi:formylglycine-generating enzyme required for sulfatase activity